MLGQASDKGQRTPFFGVGHLGLTLAHHVLTLGFLFPSFFFLELSFVIPMVARLKSAWVAMTNSPKLKA